MDRLHRGRAKPFLFGDKAPYTLACWDCGPWVVCNRDNFARVLGFVWARACHTGRLWDMVAPPNRAAAADMVDTRTEHYNYMEDDCYSNYYSSLVVRVMHLQFLLFVGLVDLSDQLTLRAYLLARFCL